jgi:hypothetical protein
LEGAAVMASVAGAIVPLPGVSLASTSTSTDGPAWTVAASAPSVGEGTSTTVIDTVAGAEAP